MLLGLELADGGLKLCVLLLEDSNELICHVLSVFFRKLQSFKLKQPMLELVNFLLLLRNDMHLIYYISQLSKCSIYRAPLDSGQKMIKLSKSGKICCNRRAVCQNKVEKSRMANY